MTTTRYTEKHHQPIAWNGNGLYKWDAEDQEWIQLTMDELVEWVNNPISRTGLFKGFTETNTLEEAPEKSPAIRYNYAFLKGKLTELCDSVEWLLMAADAEEQQVALGGGIPECYEEALTLSVSLATAGILSDEKYKAAFETLGTFLEDTLSGLRDDPNMAAEMPEGSWKGFANALFSIRDSLFDDGRKDWNRKFAEEPATWRNAKVTVIYCALGTANELNDRCIGLVADLAGSYEIAFSLTEEQ